ncbi:hypothetical protein TSAR_004957 [Trichomalopsis sarcophagae]|uniref:F-box domain-containing protein n=1 Tax=Trichomalopsis sarcophagae TaxID=543379 RepID=A0A232F8C3_9HYME|nr:hypothetical protein TSAR_004957 [Trichomalopsis sarcophagae]
MDSFHQLMNLINQHSPDDDQPDLDILKNLPLEIVLIILSKLDNDSLLNCALVSRKWLSLCKSSRSLRQKIRLHIRSKENVRSFNRSTIRSSSTSTLDASSTSFDTSRPSYRPIPPQRLPANHPIVIFDDSSIPNTSQSSSSQSVSQQPPTKRRRSSSKKPVLKKSSHLRFTSTLDASSTSFDTSRPSYRPIPPQRLPANHPIVIFDDSSIPNTSQSSSSQSVSQQPPTKRRRSSSKKPVLKKTSHLRFRSLRRKIRLHIRSKENVRSFNRSTIRSSSTSTLDASSTSFDTSRPSYRPIPPQRLPANHPIVIFDDSSIPNDTSQPSSSQSVSQQPPTRRRRSSSTKPVLKKTSHLRL